MSPAILAAAALAVQAAAPTTEPGWTLLAQDNVARYQLDPASVSRESGTVTFTIRAAPLIASEPTYVARHALDCAAGTMIVLGVNAYDSGGAHLWTREAMPGERYTIPIPPGSPQEEARQRLCARSGER